MYINYNIVSGKEYGTLTSSVRNGSKVGKGDQVYLGRVIDKEKGIFKSRERGLFTYDLKTNTFGKVPAEYIEPQMERVTKYPKRPRLVVSFGDIYVLDQYLIKNGFYEAVDQIGYRNLDTLHALLAYYLLSPHANCHAADWWDLTYAKQLFPNAQLKSQRISDALADIGSEEAKQCFFKEYFKFLAKDDICLKDSDNGHFTSGILIDSTGLPNAIHFPLTAVNNHNGQINEEVRLIYVVQQQTGMPLFFRYVAGNVVDATTILRTIAELKANGINTNMAILDAGYYNGKNADSLLDAKIPFISRMSSTYTVYQRAVKNHLDTLEERNNLVRYNNRLVYVKCIPCRIGEKKDRPAYAYLCKDLTMRNQLQKRLLEKAEDENMQEGAIFDEMKRYGVFVLVSTRRIPSKKILQVYYTRDQVEKVFELCKQDGKILPINVESEAIFRGHLLMTFIAAAILKMLAVSLSKTSITTEAAFMTLHEQHAVLYTEANELVTTEPTKNMNAIYNVLEIDCPVTLRFHETSVD